MDYVSELKKSLKVLRRAHRDFQRAQREQAQQEKITFYRQLRPDVIRLCDACRHIGHEMTYRKNEPEYDPLELNTQAVDCGNVLLELVPTEKREAIKVRATTASTNQASRYEGLETVAQIELTLRRLAFQCVKSAGCQWPLRHRLPEWEAMIHEAKCELDSALAQWMKFNKALGR